MISFHGSKINIINLKLYLMIYTSFKILNNIVFYIFAVELAIHSNRIIILGLPSAHQVHRKYFIPI